MRRWGSTLRLTLLVLAVLFAQGSLGLLNPGLNRLGAATAFLLYLACSGPWSRPWPAPGAALGALSLAVAGAVLSGATGAASLCGLVLLLLAWEIRLRAAARREALNGVLLVSLAAYLAYHLVHRSSTRLWLIEEGWAHAFSALAGWFVREPYVHGPTTQALPALVLYAIVTVVWCLGSSPRRPVRALVCVGLYVLANGLYQALLTPLAVAIQRYRPGWEDLLLNSQIFFVLLALPPSALLLRDRFAPDTRPLLGTRPWRLRLALPLAGGAVVGWLLGWSPGVAPRPGRVLFYDKGINFQAPQFGRYGDRSGGMFGLLPRYLEGLGHPTANVTKLTRGALDSASCVVTINLGSYVEADEKGALWDFVRRGGSLLVLGDHTGVLGIRGPYNDLLEPVGIEFLFDSATFLGRTWEWSLEARPHAINRGLRSDDETQIWVGASLGIEPPARPLIVARYGYSDLGDLANDERAFLGDRRYNPGEILGDLVLVAEARAGRGKVLVFGDTSSFQNLALFGSHAFVARVFRWLTGETKGLSSWVRIPALALLVAAGMLWICLLAPPLVPVGAAAAALGVGWSAASWPREPPVPHLELETAVVDASHTPRFDTLSWEDDSIGGLCFNLIRNGYWPLLRERFEPQVYAQSDLLVCIAPAAPFERREIEWVEDFARSGGHVLLTVGYEESAGSRQLLRAFGARIANMPLTTGSTEIWGHRVQLHEAWPVLSERPEARVLGELLGSPVVVYLPLGRGGLLAVGDTYFLQNRNLEGREQWNEGNILFLRELVTRLRQGRVFREAAAAVDPGPRTAPPPAGRDSLGVPAGMDLPDAAVETP